MKKLWVIALFLALGASAPCQAKRLPAFEQEIEVGALGKRTWKTILLIFRNTDVDYVDENGQAGHFAGSLSEDEISGAFESYQQMPELALSLAEGLGGMEVKAVVINDPIVRVSSDGSKGAKPDYWLRAEDLDPTLSALVKKGSYDSVFVLWKMGPLPHSAWGRGQYINSRGYTLASVKEGSPEQWATPAGREIWLHEWLHGVCQFFSARGYAMPDGDADGGKRHGYALDPEAGWTGYYGDLMHGGVYEKKLKKFVGITHGAWISATPSSAP